VNMRVRGAGVGMVAFADDVQGMGYLEMWEALTGKSGQAVEWCCRKNRNKKQERKDND